jgi:hypothetical protein
MNNKFFPPSVSIIAITGLSLIIIARIAAFCTPRNSICSFIICFNASWILIARNRLHQLIRASLYSFLNNVRFLFSPVTVISREVAGNSKNRYYITLYSRNCWRLLIIFLSRFIILRAYIMPFTWDVCSVCSAVISYLVFLFRSPFSSSSSGRNAFFFCIYRRLILIVKS